MRLGNSIVVTTLLLVSLEAFADELKLKDGTKIVGTIVGFEDNSFKVKTSYGFAEVQKDQVLSINVTDSAKGDANQRKPEPAFEKTFAPASSTNSEPANAAASAHPAEPANKTASSVAAPTASPTANKSPRSVGPPTRPASSAPAPNVTENVATSFVGAPPAAPIPSTPAAPVPARADAKSFAAPASAPPAPVVAAQPKPAAAEPVREQVSGNMYSNDTYGFRMYKPPDWQVIAGARTILPGSITALGTNDQTTLLVIGREHAKDSLDAHAATTEKALRDVYENYRLILNRHLSVAGFPAVEQRSRGTADGRDWSVILLTLFKGPDAFTLLGMTWADSDLIQVQENVIAKAVNSLTFTVQ